MQEGRCGYIYAEDDNDVSHRSCCYRQVASSDAQYCVWHTNKTEMKTTSALKSACAPSEIRDLNSPVRELLDGADLSGSNLADDIGFDDVSLRGANLARADLAFVDFENVHLKGADLWEATLTGSELTGADLRSADLSASNLWNATLHETHLRSADLSDAELQSATLSNAYLKDANLSGIYAPYADLSSAGLWNATLTGAFLKNATLLGASLKHADLSEANLENADLSEANLENADLSEANLENADLSGAVVRDANLRDASLSDATLTDSNLQAASLDGADLGRAALTSAVLEDATLRNVNLTDSSLNRASLAGADLTGAHLFGAAFDGARVSGQTMLHEHGIGDVGRSADYCRYDPAAPPSDPVASLREDGDELAALDESPDVVQLRRARSTYRRLEDLARQNGFPDVQATMFKRRQEMRRHLLGKQGHTLKYWFTSLQRHVFVYGESVRRIIGISAGVILGFWLWFLLSGTVATVDETVVTLSAARADPTLFWVTFYHSVSVFFTGTAVLEPAGLLGAASVALEMVAGPVLVALLIFVLGRRAAR